jgi:hypothetical protein
MARLSSFWFARRSLGIAVTTAGLLAACDATDEVPTETSPVPGSGTAPRVEFPAAPAGGYITSLLRARQPDTLSELGSSNHTYRTAEGNVIRVFPVSPTPPQGPVYVVDGVVIDEFDGNIRPDRIATIEFVRNKAEAVKRFGIRASNGAIIVTTKPRL